jgi:hypothetical protein
MKSKFSFRKLLSALALAAFAVPAAGQGLNLQPDIQFYRQPGFQGLNVFETSKEDNVPYNGLAVRVGGDFAMQFQGINHSTGSTTDTLSDLSSNFNLPTANLNLDVQLADGMRMHLRTYLSSRHHSEAWVKGGYIQIDKLDWISEGFGESVMKMLTIKIGMNDINYGDAHFRRSDNAMAIYNPFVGNYLMDAFTTEAFGEVTFQKSGWLGVVGITNSKLNQSVKNNSDDLTPTFYGKVGYDKQMNEDLRVRLTGSVLYSGGLGNGGYLYGGDRAGSRYYHVMETDAASNDFSGRYNPRFKKFTSFQINPFVKWKGFEFFGVFEVASGDKTETVTGGSVTQLGTELIYRFGSKDQLYVGGRYNSVSGKESEAGEDLSISRIQGGFGWFMTDNVLAKVEYVTQDYSGDHWNGSVFQDGNFNGIVLEAVIGF